MKTLNLTDLDKSDIKYKIQKFPDGQQNIVIIFDYFVNTPLPKGHPNDLKSYSVQIKSRLNNWLDLELIVCAIASLRELGVEEIHLYTPYIIGARSDRNFEGGGNNYLKDVICPIINSLNFKTVTCIDPHSDVLEACINNFKKESNLELVNFTIKDLIWKQKEIKSNTPLNSLLENIILVSPDAGASKKIYKLAEQIGYKGDIITCSKERDTDGKLTRINVPISLAAGHGDKDMIIIDDICDGGATFINIAKRIKEYKYNNKIYLIVTHGIFSKGFEELSKYFDGIYCTNSYRDICIDHGYTPKIEKHSSIVHQLNVF